MYDEVVLMVLELRKIDSDRGYYNSKCRSSEANPSSSIVQYMSQYVAGVWSMQTSGQPGKKCI